MPGTDKRFSLRKAGTRAVRTGSQMGVAAVIMGLVEAFFSPKFTPEQLTAIGAAVTLVVGIVQNLLEENHVVPNMLEEPITTTTDTDAYQPDGGGE